MSDVSFGQRGWDSIRWFAYEARSRPVALLAVAVALGGVTGAASAVSSAGSLPFNHFDTSVAWVAGGFGIDTQLCLVIAAVLLVIDRMSGAEYRGQHAIFAALAALGAVGLVVNVIALIVLLIISGLPTGEAGTLTEAYTGVICGYLAPALLSAVVGWVGLSAIRPGLGASGSPR